jgi:molybdate transport system substrate-binding protein
MHMRLVVLLFALGVLLGAAHPSAQTFPLLIAAAADLQTVMPDLMMRFERESRVPTQVSYGSSGNFFAQIQNGAPFDVFFSADVDYPRRLVESGHAERDSLYEYATGHLVLWTRGDSNIDVSGGLAFLASAAIRRIAIANPTYAPYGRAAVAALQHEQLYDKVQSKLVLGENISQTAQFAQTGNADVAIVSLSFALGPALKNGKYSEIPQSFYPAIRQAAVLMRRSRNKAAARQLLAFLRRPQSVQLLTTFGFVVPAAAK